MSSQVVKIIGWVAMALTCAGNILIIYKQPEGFAVWIFGNIAWSVIALNVKPKLYSQVWNMVIYAACNVWGWVVWSGT